MAVCCVSAQDGPADLQAAYGKMLEGREARNWSSRSKRRYKLAYGRACRLKPKDVNIHWQWALIELSHGSYRDADLVLAKALRIAPKQPYALRAQSYCWSRRVDFNRSTKLLIEAARQHGDNEEVGYNAGMLLAIVGRREKEHLVKQFDAKLRPLLKGAALQAREEAKADYRHVYDLDIAPIIAYYDRVIRELEAEWKRADKEVVARYRGLLKRRGKRGFRRRGERSSVYWDCKRERKALGRKYTGRINRLKKEGYAKLDAIERTLCQFDLAAASNTTLEVGGRSRVLNRH